MNKPVLRYSDADLEEFRVLIEKKLERAKEQLALLQSQILEVTENNDGDYGQDMMDDSNTNTDVEMLNSLAIHQRKYVRELENALGRIRNKTYGICEVSGELIDKKRLLAVPTTTKSLAAKLGITPTSPAVEVAETEEDEEKKVAARPRERQVITKVIRKLPTKRTGGTEIPDEEDDELMRTPSDWADEEDTEEDNEVPYQDMDEFADDDSAF